MRIDPGGEHPFDRGTNGRGTACGYSHPDLTWKGIDPVEVLDVAGEVKSRKSGQEAELNGGWSLGIDALDAELLRVAVLPPEGQTVDRTWMIAPGRLLANSD